MSNVAHFVTFMDNPFTVTAGQPKLIDDEIKPLVGVDKSRNAVLAFNLKVRGNFVHLTMEFNGTQFFTDFLNQTITARLQARHEILPGSILDDQNNQLIIHVAGFFGTPHVDFSDFVLTYHVV